MKIFCLIGDTLFCLNNTQKVHDFIYTKEMFVLESQFLSVLSNSITVSSYL